MTFILLLILFSTTSIASGFLISGNTNRMFNSQLYMIWAYPLYDDSPKRGRRRKINQAFEFGPTRVNTTLDYEYANRLAQNTYNVPGEGVLPYLTEEGLGESEDIHTSFETACGGVDIDEDEFAKISKVYKIFNDRNCGVLKIIGAKLRHFSFLYNGPIRHKYGIKCYLRYMINRVYPGSKVTLLTHESHDPTPLKRGVNPKLFGKQKRLMVTGKDYRDVYNDGFHNDDTLYPKIDMLI